MTDRFVLPQDYKWRVPHPSIFEKPYLTDNWYGDGCQAMRVPAPDAFVRHAAKKPATFDLSVVDDRMRDNINRASDPATLYMVYLRQMLDKTMPDVAVFISGQGDEITFADARRVSYILRRHSEISLHPDSQIVWSAKPTEVLVAYAQYSVSRGRHVVPVAVLAAYRLSKSEDPTDVIYQMTEHVRRELKSKEEAKVLTAFTQGLAGK